MNKKNVENYLDKIKKYLETKDLDYYDIRFVNSNIDTVNLENKEIKDINYVNKQGIGIRLYKNQKLGFCSFNQFDKYKEIIDKSISNLKYINKKTKLENFEKHKKRTKIKHQEFSQKDIKSQAKDFLKLNKEYLAKKDINIKKINTHFFQEYYKKYFISPYSYIVQETPYIRIHNFFTAKRNEIIEKNHSRFADICGREKTSFKDKEKIYKDNYKITKELLYSKPAPAKKSDIIVADGLSGLLAHEAIGHSMEADFLENNQTMLTPNKKVTDNKNVNLFDDPTKKTFGHYKFDDEGTKAKKAHLIKNGIVNEHLKNIESATYLGEKSNGFARAQNYNFMPVVRMSNTYFAPGKDKYKDLLKDFTGYILKGFAGGQVNTDNGNFMFGIKQAIKYEKGILKNTYKNASISGNILDYLNKIDGIRDKLGSKDPGYCGKDGQTMYVSDNGPDIKFKNVVVGGSKHGK